MKITLTICLIFLCSIGMAQKLTENMSLTGVILTDSLWKKMPDSIRNRTISQATINPQYYFQPVKTDTIPVIGYVLVNIKRLKFKWMHLYAVTGNDINFNSIIPGGGMYKKYLYADRKTKVINQVIFAIVK
jgi:hypothetical protein